MRQFKTLEKTRFKNDKIKANDNQSTAQCTVNVHIFACALHKNLIKRKYSNNKKNTKNKKDHPPLTLIYLEWPEKGTTAKNRLGRNDKVARVIRSDGFELDDAYAWLVVDEWKALNGGFQFPCWFGHCRLRCVCVTGSVQDCALFNSSRWWCVQWFTTAVTKITTVTNYVWCCDGSFWRCQWSRDGSGLIPLVDCLSRKEYCPKL